MNNYIMFHHFILVACVFSYTSVHGSETNTNDPRQQQLSSAAKIKLMALLDNRDLDASDTHEKIRDLLQECPSLRTEFLRDLITTKITPHDKKWKKGRLLLGYCMQPPHTHEESELLKQYIAIIQSAQEQASTTIRQLETANQECSNITTQLSTLLRSADTQPVLQVPADFDALIAHYSLPKELFEGKASTNNETAHMHYHVRYALIDKNDGGICTDPIHNTTLTLEIYEQDA